MLSMKIIGETTLDMLLQNMLKTQSLHKTSSDSISSKKHRVPIQH